MKNNTVNGKVVSWLENIKGVQYCNTKTGRIIVHLEDNSVDYESDEGNRFSLERKGNNIIAPLHVV